MLGKLMKHEWNAVTKVMLPANLVLIAITLIGRVMISAKIFDTDNAIVGAFCGLATGIYVLCLLAISLLCTIFLAYRFYKTTYTDEGYLLHTLPVTSHEIILSKTLAGAIWSLITSALLILSVIVLVLGVVPSGEFAIFMRDASNTINTYLGGRFTAWCIFFVFMMIISCLYSLLCLFAGISFVQLFPKHKVLGAFIGYAAIYFVIQIITYIIMFVSGIFGKAMNMDQGGPSAVISYCESVFLLSIGISIVFAVLFYIFTNYMMQKKLNLD